MSNLSPEAIATAALRERFDDLTKAFGRAHSASLFAIIADQARRIAELEKLCKEWEDSGRSYARELGEAHLQLSKYRHVPLSGDISQPSPPPSSELQSYKDADGCPTEMAVLQRFWRAQNTPMEGAQFPVSNSGSPPPTTGARELATKIARSIFELGDEPWDKVQRLEFKGGTYPKKETALGGMNEAALADQIEWAIKQTVVEPPKAQERMPEIDCAEDCVRWGATKEMCRCRERRRLARETSTANKEESK